jgi:hypothetical protein
MPNPKRTIPVSEVQPGDSIQIGGVRGPLFVTEFGVDRARISTINPDGESMAFIVSPHAPVTVGFTNRKAKRLRGKMARRMRFAGRIRGASHTFTWLDDAGSWPTDAQV